MEDNIIYYSIINKKVLGDNSQTIQARTLLKEMLKHLYLMLIE